MSGLAIALPRKRRRRRRPPRGVEWMVLAVFVEAVCAAWGAAAMFVLRDAPQLTPGVVLDPVAVVVLGWLAVRFWHGPLGFPGVRCVRRLVRDWLVGEPE